VRLSTHQLAQVRGAMLDSNAVVVAGGREHDFEFVFPNMIVDLIDEVIESRETIADMVKALHDAGVEIRVRSGADA
jgi:hypothetical protein